MSKGRRHKSTGTVGAESIETAEQKFQRLAKKRTNAAVVKIGYVGNCFGVGYKYTPEQAAKVIAALTDAVADVEAKSSKTERISHGFDW